MHAFLHAAYQAAKKQQIPNKTEPNKANQPTYQTIKQPNDQQITQPPENQTIQHPTIKPTNQEKNSTNHTKTKQIKSSQTKTKQKRNKPDKAILQQTNYQPFSSSAGRATELLLSSRNRTTEDEGTTENEVKRKLSKRNKTKKLTLIKKRSSDSERKNMHKVH